MSDQKQAIQPLPAPAMDLMEFQRALLEQIRKAYMVNLPEERGLSAAEEFRIFALSRGAYWMF